MKFECWELCCIILLIIIVVAIVRNNKTNFNDRSLLVPDFYNLNKHPYLQSYLYADKYGYPEKIYSPYCTN